MNRGSTLKTVAFFNNKGGVGKTTLVYHLAWTYADLGVRVLMLDLDPQANLTALCVDEARLEQLWSDDIETRRSIYTCVRPIKEELGDIARPELEPLAANLALIPGDADLAGFEAKLWDAWPRALDRHLPSFRALSSFHRIALDAAQWFQAELVLIDVGPNLGALNRTALIASQHVVVPLGADLFSIQALRNLGPALREWRSEWAERLPKNPDPKLSLPEGKMEPVGYVVMQPSLYGDGVTKAHAKWLERMPRQFAESLAQLSTQRTSVTRDPKSLGVVKHLRSLMPLAHEARKPVFHLRPADGALGAHATAAQQAGREFKKLAKRIATEIGFDIQGDR
jgi:chromosome partitioning protein